MNFLDKDKKVSIIFEDDDLLVVDKPSGLVVNISMTSPIGTLQHYLQDYLNLPISDTEFYSRTGLVHRLDKDTSGVLLVAKNEQIFTSLQSQFKKRLVKKEYVAITFGTISDSKIQIDAPIARSTKNRLKYAISKNGKPAHTSAEVIQTFSYCDKDLTKVQLFPLSGRTHQLRVHLAALRHPIVGDVIYSTKRMKEWSRSANINRLLLHAHKITIKPFRDNSTDDMKFESNLPKIFSDISAQ